MVTGALAAAWAGLVLAGFHRWGPAPARRRAQELAQEDRTSAAPGTGRRLSLVVGRLALRLVRRPAPPEAAARLGRAVLAAAAALVVVAPAAPVVGAGVWIWPALGERRRRRRRRAELLRHLPEVADLLVLAVGAGLTVPLAVAAVARRAPGPLAPALGQAIAEVGLGRRLADALDDVPRQLGEDVRPLIAALVASDRYGAPLLDSLVRLSVELRADRRRRAEAAARRVPVKLLFPLVFCTLPAFALLTVAPLIAGALRSLRL
jgi:Flp pilus assembly protein TadB